MNVALLSAANSIHTQKIANSLVSLGHSVTLFSLPNHHDRDGEYDKSVKIVYLKNGGFKGYFSNAGELKKLLNSGGKKFDVLNAHYASGYGSLGGLTGFHPYVLSVWGSDVYSFPYQNPANKLLLKHNLKKADLIFSTSNCMAKQTGKFISGKKIIITPFGVDTEALKPSPRKADGLINIGFIKGVSETYGIRYLVEAFKKVKAACPDYRLRLLVYGDGDQTVEMKELSKTLGIDGEVTFFGRIPHDSVPEALSCMDIFCVPSTMESFGVSALEAMAFGIPCVVSDAEGLSEVMLDGKTGFVVPKRNPDALAEKIISLVKNPGLRASFGENARNHVIRHYNWDDNIKIIESGLVSAAKSYSGR